MHNKGGGGVALSLIDKGQVDSTWAPHKLKVLMYKQNHTTVVSNQFGQGFMGSVV